jgi:hypothetical protein
MLQGETQAILTGACGCSRLTYKESVSCVSRVFNEQFLTSGGEEEEQREEKEDRKEY